MAESYEQIESEVVSIGMTSLSSNAVKKLDTDRTLQVSAKFSSFCELKRNGEN